MDLIFEKSIEGRRGYSLPESDVPSAKPLAAKYVRPQSPTLPEVGELDVVRHFMALSRRNFSVDGNFYPLGSCTMKYNPRFTEVLAAMSGLADLHPLLPQLASGDRLVQGALAILYEMEQLLCEITGFSAFTLQPLAGAHGELTGAMMIAAYHKAKKNRKKYIIAPDSAHGTNPASAAIAGFQTITIPSTEEGVMDLAALERALTDEVAGIMLTCPDTAGIFNRDIDKIAQMVHKVDGLMYYDGANLNAVLGRCRPGDLGFDVMHINLHKTFSTPHGGGGPGAGPVGVGPKLMPYLPVSRVVRRDDGTFRLNYDYPESIGYVASFYGNFAVIVRAYAYILLLGKEGLKQVSDHAVLNANYVMARLKGVFDLPFDRTCMHECVFSACAQSKNGVHAIDLAKYLIDQGIHPMTVYFPLIVREAMMIEPTETESKQTIDRFIQCMMDAADLAARDPEAFHAFPKTMPISRPDEVKAVKDLNVNFFD
ncbi:MAG TPA: aminomethyl-transferring glycine dehydrogenase subunit GcvPB [Candidatus Omnitrophota bacterium]|nr:aminomethyl-transferring glycine dehydrogenase subunit GcvPB [Candidatus Omnitrophota bacterium]